MFADSYMDSPSVVQRLFHSDWFRGTPIITVAAILSETVQKSKWIVMILGVNLGYHSKKLYPLINDQYTVHPDEAFRFAIGSFIENVWIVLVYRQTKANMLTLMLHETVLII